MHIEQRLGRLEAALESRSCPECRGYERLAVVSIDQAGCGTGMLPPPCSGCGREPLVLTVRRVPGRTEVARAS
jgi:hypothetical protein